MEPQKPEQAPKRSGMIDLADFFWEGGRMNDTFKFHFSAWQQTYTRMMETLKAVPELDCAKMQAAVTAQIENWRAAEWKI